MRLPLRPSRLPFLTATALCVAVQAFKHGYHPHHPDKPALEEAVAAGKPHEIKVLLKHGKEIDARDSKGRTALHEAAAYAAWKLPAIHSVKELIHLGSDVDAWDDEGETPLHKAANSFCGHIHALKALIHAGAKLNIPNFQGKTPLHIAASQGNADGVQALMDAGARLDVRDVQGETPLHKATSGGYVMIAQALLAAGANTDIQNNRGETALAIASFRGYSNLVKVLIIKGANPEVKDAQGETALHKAARWEFVDVVQALAGAGARLDARNNQGKTPGFLAVEYNKTLSVEALFSYSSSWAIVGDDSQRLPWDVTANQAVLAVLPAPSWWERSVHLLGRSEFYIAVCCALAIAFPLAQLLVVSIQHTSHIERHREPEPSPGAQHMASVAVLGGKAPAAAILPALLFRAFEVSSASILLVWSFGCLLQPSLSAMMVMVVYILPSTMIVGYKPALQCPALCIISATRSVALYPPKALRIEFALVVGRCVALLLVPGFLALLLLPSSDSSSHFLGISLSSADLAGPFLNLRKLAQDNPAGYCLLNPGIGLVSTQLSQCILHFHLFHVVLPFVLFLLAASVQGYYWYVAGFNCCIISEMEVIEESAQEKQQKIRSLAIELDKIVAKAPREDPEVWRVIGRVIESNSSAEASLAAPATEQTFWKSPYFDVGMMAADLLSDLYMMQNVFLHQYWWSGSFLLGVLTFAIFAEVMTGTTPQALLQEARESERLGFRTARFKAMQQHEAAWEALPSLIISSFAFWSTVNEWHQVVLCSASLLLSLYSVIRYLHEKLDLQLSVLDGDCEEKRQLFDYYSNE